MDRLLTTSEAAAILERTTSRVTQLIAEGEIEAERFRRGKREHVRLRESVVREYKKSRQIPDALPSQ